MKMHADLRKAHTRKLTAKRISVRGSASRPGYSYVRKARTVRVKGQPAYDVGTIGRPKSLIGPLKHGMLTKFGYHPVEAMTNRHKALMLAINKGKEEPRAVFRRLMAISTLTKRMAPRAHRIYKQDAMWVRVRYASRFKTPLK
jgi:hypothetical protein